MLHELQNLVLVGAISVAALAAPAHAQLDVGPEETIMSAGVPLVVVGYSDPSVCDWNNDGLFDLVVGDSDHTLGGKVRIFLNVGTAGSPSFGGFFYAQAFGGDLYVPGCG